MFFSPFLDWSNFFAPYIVTLLKAAKSYKTSRKKVTKN